MTIETRPVPAAQEAAPSEDPLALDRQVCFALAVASRNVIGLYRPALEPLGLTHPQYLVMLALWQYGGLSVKELGRLLQLDSGTLSPLVKRLTISGLVAKERSHDDERSVIVSLTAAGRALRQRAEAVPHEVVARLGLSQDQLIALHQALLPVLRAVEHATPTWHPSR